eukprot:3796047-Lingulodinium_polyedra.AAC.1
MMRSNRPSAVAAARKSHVSCTPCEHQFWFRVECAKRAFCEPLWWHPSSAQAAPKQHPSSAQAAF